MVGMQGYGGRANCGQRARMRQVGSRGVPPCSPLVAQKVGGSWGMQKVGVGPLVPACPGPNTGVALGKLFHRFVPQFLYV